MYSQGSSFDHDDSLNPCARDRRRRLSRLRAQQTLLDRGYKVTVLDNFMYRQNSLMDCCGEEGFQVVRGDCRDERLLTDLLRTPTSSFHLPR
jgi:hypothetical protein